MVKRIIYPPIWLVLGLVSIFFLNEYYPGPRFTSPWGHLAGALFILVGLVLLVGANGLFNKAGTDVIPFQNVSALVTDGVYQYTRNPMYLGMFAVLLGCAITVVAGGAVLILFVFALFIDRRFLRAEEAMLRELFPQEFPAYCARVRRWL